MGMQQSFPLGNIELAANGERALEWWNPASRFLVLLLGFNATEVIALILIVLYGIVFVLGMHARREKERVLTKVIIPALSKQFAHVEPSKSDGINELTWYATGRRNCRSCLIRMKLKNGHDLFHFMILDPLLKNEH